MENLRKALSKVQPPKVSVTELKTNAEYRPAQIQPAGVQQSGLEGLGRLMQKGADIYKEHVRQRNELGVLEKNKIMMNGMDAEQIKQARQSGALPFQYDPYAMMHLERELGAKEAANADDDVQAKIANGDFKNRQEMEDYRMMRLSEANNNMAEAYGITDRTHFNQGFAADEAGRSQRVSAAQVSKTDAEQRNVAMAATRSGVNNLQRSGASGKDIAEFLKLQQDKGIIRNRSEFNTQLQLALKDTAARPDGYNDVLDLLNTEIDYNGQKLKLGDSLGTAQSNLILEQSKQSALNNNVDRYAEFDQIKTKLASMPYETADDILKANEAWQVQWDALAKAQPDQQVTPQKAALLSIRKQQNEQADALRGKLAKQQEANRAYKIDYLDFDKKVMGNITGQTNDLNIKSQISRVTGKRYDPQFTQKYFIDKVNSIRGNEDLTPEQRAVQEIQVMSQFRNMDEGGFGSAYKKQQETIQNEQTKLAMWFRNPTTDRPATPVLDQQQALYQAAPSAYIQNYGDDANTVLGFQVAGDLGIDAAQYANGGFEYNKLGKEEQRMASQNWQSTLTKQGNQVMRQLNASTSGALRNQYNALIGMGTPPNVAVEQIKKLTDTHYASTWQMGDDSWGSSTTNTITGAVPKRLLVTNATDPKSFKVGQRILLGMANKQFGTSQFQNANITSSGNSVIITTGDGQRMIKSRDEIMAEGKSMGIIK